MENNSRCRRIAASTPSEIALLYLHARMKMPTAAMVQRRTHTRLDRPGSRSQISFWRWGLFYHFSLSTMVQSTWGCKCWGPAVDGGYWAIRKLRMIAVTDFVTLPKLHWMPLETWCSTVTISASAAEPIPLTRSFTKKREVFPGLSATVQFSGVQPLSIKGQMSRSFFRVSAQTVVLSSRFLSYRTG